MIVHDSGDVRVQDCDGIATSSGNNLIGDPTTRNIQLTDGTPGNAHYPLLPDSEGIDAANAAACPKEDQLGRPRTVNCDIGAVEFNQGLIRQFGTE